MRTRQSSSRHRTSPKDTLRVMVSIVLLVGVAAVAVINVRAYRERRAQLVAMDALKREVNALQEDAIAQQALLASLKSPYAVEREARMRLGYKREGEQVVVFPSVTSTPDMQTAKQEMPPYYRAWVAYFFGE